MTETLDKILSGPGEATPAPEPAKETQAEPQGQQATTEPQDEVIEQNGRKMVPLEALTETRGKVKRYTEEVADFRKQLTETNAAWERRMSDVLQAVRQPPQPSKAPVQPPDFYENPDAATDYRVDQRVTPQFAQMNQVLMANAQLVAGVKYGDDKVSDAEKAFIQAMEARELDPVDYHKVVNSPNRYAAAVQWHQKHQAEKEIGGDPVAFRAKLEAEILAKHGITPQAEGGAQAPAQAAPVMPSNLATARSVAARSGPTWGGPTPLGDIFKR